MAQEGISDRLRWVVDRFARGSQAEAARRIRISPAGLSRILAAGGSPNAETLAAILRAFPTVNPDWLLTGEGEAERAADRDRLFLRWQGAPGHTSMGEAEPSADEAAALALFRHFEGMVRQMGGAGDIAPAELKLRRLDALEGIRRLFSAVGEVPGWWFRLKDQVERDEL